jgi:hypothetical protein
MFEFKPFQKIPRLSRECIITEKIDGTNASIHITEEGEFITCSRNQIITPEKDNYGFSRWANENKEELLKLGVGSHFGEWWGLGIQRGYGATQKYWSLFNVSKWTDDIRPKCCKVVPVLHVGMFDTTVIDKVIESLKNNGSKAMPFMNPEGIVVYHTSSRTYFKKTILNDEKGKEENEIQNRNSARDTFR